MGAGKSAKVKTPELMGETVSLLQIFVDADACPVKQEIYRVAKRCGLPVTLVANSWMRIPPDPSITLQIVSATQDSADDWIAGHAGPRDIVVTADIPLANRCLKEGARVISTTGKPFTEDNIGPSVAMRELLSDLREAGTITGGPPPLTQRDRSFFLQKLDDAIQAVRRATA